MLADAARHDLVVTVEDGVRIGGAGSHLLDAMATAATEDSLAAAGRATPGPATRMLGVPRTYLAQGKADDILRRLGLDGPGVAATVRQALHIEPAPEPTLPR